MPFICTVHRISIHLSLYHSIYLSISIYLFINLSIYLSISLFTIFSLLFSKRLFASISNRYFLVPLLSFSMSRLTLTRQYLFYIRYVQGAIKKYIFNCKFLNFLFSSRIKYPQLQVSESLNLKSPSLTHTVLKLHSRFNGLSCSR